MKKITVLPLSFIFYILSFISSPNIAIASHGPLQFGPIPSGGCPPGYMENGPLCLHTSTDTGIGTISPPPTIPNVTGDPSTFVAGIIRTFIDILIIAAFIIALIWTIFAGYSFIFAGGDPKNISQAWSRIYWGLLGLVVVVGAFAIIKLVETAFNVTIISGGFQLPQRP